jgi:transposase-like protein
MTGQIAMECVGCSSGVVTERPALTAQGYHRFRCRDCDKQFNERSDGDLNRASLPSDIIAFVVFCCLQADTAGPERNHAVTGGLPSATNPSGGGR